MTNETHIKILTDQLSVNIKMISMVCGLVNEGHGNTRMFETLTELQKINNDISKQLVALKCKSDEI
jgi:hypothetical protein